MQAVVKSSVASMRDEPRADIPLSDEVLYGMMAQILEEPVNGWYKVRTDYQYEGYLSGADLLFDPQLTGQWAQLSHKRVYQAYADILSAPDVESLLLISLPRGAVIHEAEPEKEPGGWVRVLLCDGTSGYTKSKFIGTFHDRKSGQNEDEFRQNVLDTAKSYMGTQYRWGGKTPLGIDCSGLTSMSYLINGVTIYRDAQIREGFPVREIAFQDKKPGDLLFFTGHVAMYLGEGRYIHSTGKNGSDGVVINSLDPEAPDYRDDLPDRLYATGSIF